MQPLLRIPLRCIVEHADVGDDQRVGAGCYGIVDAALPDVERARPREGVDGDQHLDAAPVSAGNACAHLVAAEVQAREVARIGLVAEAAIDRVGAGIDGDVERRRRARRTDQLHRPLSARPAGGAAVAGLASTPRTSRSTIGDSGPSHATDSATTSMRASSMALRSATTASMSPSIWMSREREQRVAIAVAVGQRDQGGERTGDLDVDPPRQRPHRGDPRLDARGFQHERERQIGRHEAESLVGIGTETVEHVRMPPPDFVEAGAEQRLQGQERQYPPREGEHRGYPRYGRTGHRHGINLSNDPHNIGRQQNSLSGSKEISLIPCSGCGVAGSGRSAPGRPAGTARRAISPHFRDTPT